MFWAIRLRFTGSRPKRVTLEFRDLDCLTTEEEVRDAVKRDPGDLAGEVKVTLARVNSREQKMSMELGERGGAKLLEAGRIKIGWVYSRVRRRILVMRCYACFGFGHHQSSCKGPDRKRLGVCIQCGGMDDMKKDCRAEPKCFL